MKIIDGLLNHVLSYSNDDEDNWDRFYSPNSEMFLDYATKFQLAMPVYMLCFLAYKMESDNKHILELILLLKECFIREIGNIGLNITLIQTL